MSDEKTNYEGLEQDDYIELPVPEDDVKEPVKKSDDAAASSSDSSESSDAAVVSEDKPSPKKEPVKKTAKKTVTKKKAKKKVVKKAAKKTASSVSSASKKSSRSVKKSSRRKSRSLDWLWVLLIVIGAAIIAVVAFMLVKSGSSDSTADNSSLAVVATVNGEPIYQQDVDSLYDSLPASLKQQTSRDALLNQMIDQKLLLQEAKKKGIEVSDSEIDDYVNSLLAFFNINDSRLRSLLDKQGISYEQFIDNSRNQIMISKLINESVISTVNISDSEVADYYENNKESFVVPETVVVRHILLRPKDNESTDELLQRAESVKELIADDFSNFCDLVSNYSEDPGSKDSCGEYSVRQDGTFVKSFEDAAFNMSVNETSIVESPFGVHIIWKVSEQPETQQSLDEVKDQIVEILKQQKIPELVKEFVDSLREKADIVFYSPDGSEVPSDSSGSSESSVSSESSATSDSSESSSVDSSDSGSSVEEAQVADSSSVSSESSDHSSLADCLSEKNAVMYGVSWAPDVQAQKDLLGEEVMSKVKYVDCEASDAPEECSDVNVYPTWVIDGKTLKGKQSLNALASASSCLS